MKLTTIEEGWRYRTDANINSLKSTDDIRKAVDFTYDPTNAPDDFALTPEHLQELRIKEHAYMPEYILSGVEDAKIYYIFRSKDIKLMLALARAIKKPEKATETEAEEIMLRISIDMIKKLPPYDFIVHPESSSQFNMKLAAMTGASQIQIPKSENIDANFRELVRRAILMKFFSITERGRRYAVVGEKGSTKHIYDSRWPYHAAIKDRNVITQKMANSTSIKSIWHSKRRYLDLFQPIDLNSLTGKSVLIIDDNVATAGTAEILLAQVAKVNPARLDMFTPIVLSSF